MRTIDKHKFLAIVASITLFIIISIKNLGGQCFNPIEISISYFILLYNLIVMIAEEI